MAVTTKKTGKLNNGNKGNGAGRPKGTPNKVTATVRNALEQSLNDGAGAVAFFNELKQDDPKTYAGVIAKLIPIQVQQEIQANSTVNTTTKIEFIKQDDDN